MDGWHLRKVCLCMQGQEMAFIWHERTHDNVDVMGMADLQCLNILGNCGLLKFFLTPLLRAQLDLLEYLIRAWNPIEGKFIICGQEIDFDAIDI